MFKAILFDLDDTLLANPMERFIPAYFAALSGALSHLIPPRTLIAELMRGSQAMEENDGSGPTNEEAFAAVFYPAVRREQAELKPFFERFYAEEFPRLRELTQPLPDARRTVEWAFERGLQVAIATNPFFPRSAIDHRLAWAGVPSDEFDYDLVTSYEVMHATKAHPAYYREIVERLGREPRECLMVGDDWQRDMAPAAEVGISIYWITKPNDTLLPIPPLEKQEKGSVMIGQGSLTSLWDWMNLGGLGNPK